MYLSSLEDPSLCPEGTHVFTLIGPSMASWPAPTDAAYRGTAYQEHKQREAAAMIGLLDRRFPGFARQGAALGARHPLPPSSATSASRAARWPGPSRPSGRS